MISTRDRGMFSHCNEAIDEIRWTKGRFSGVRCRESRLQSLIWGIPVNFYAEEGDHGLARKLQDEGITSAQYAAGMEKQHLANRWWACELERAIARADATCVADVGAGTGTLVRIVACRHPTIQFDCYDIDAEAIEIGRACAARDNLKNVCFRQVTDEEVLPGAREYDLVFSRFVLHHLADPRAHMECLLEMLRPGGLLLVVDLQHDALSALFYRLRLLPRFLQSASRRVMQHAFVASLDVSLTGGEARELVASLGCEFEFAGHFPQPSWWAMIVAK